MTSLHYDLKFLQAGIPELQAYLLSNEIYWPLGLAAPLGEPPYPLMTLGWLLLSQARVTAWMENSPDTGGKTVPHTHRTLDDIRARWLVAWEKKAAQEFSSRLNLWADYLNEYRADHASHAQRYVYEVQRRVILHLLQAETRELPSAELELLRGMDKYLQAVLQPGEFIWATEIAEGFPKAKYWYLYGQMPKK